MTAMVSTIYRSELLRAVQLALASVRNSMRSLLLWQRPSHNGWLLQLQLPIKISIFDGDHTRERARCRYRNESQLECPVQLHWPSELYLLLLVQPSFGD